MASRDASQLVLKRVSYFWPFKEQQPSQYYVPLKGSFSKYVTWKGGRSARRKQQKMTIERRARSQKGNVPHKDSSMYFFSVTQSFRLGFWWGFDNITVSNKKSTSKKESTSVWNNYIVFAQKYYNSSTLSMCVVCTNMCL